MDTTSKIIFITILMFLIILSGIFSASETALMALSKSKIKVRKMKEENIKGIDVLVKVTEDSNRLLSTILIANNIVNIGASALATSLFTDMLGVSGVPVATAIMTTLVLIFGEITPKSIASRYPEKVSLVVIRLIRGVMFIFRPLVFILDIIRVCIFKILRIEEDYSEVTITEEELKVTVEVAHEEGVIEEEKKEIIDKIFNFSDTVAKKAMVNRMNIIAISSKCSYEELKSMLIEEKFTRIPVYEETIDNIVGIINIKDVVFLSEDEISKFNALDYTRDAFFTYEYKQASNLLDEMKEAKAQMAIVVDEYGSTAGILTIEDLIEEIVGDIDDEYDTEEECDIRKIGEDEFLVNASAFLSDVSEAIGFKLQSEDFDSIGGYIIDKLKGFPQENELVVIDGIKFTIEDTDKNKINKIKINTSPIDSQVV